MVCLFSGLLGPQQQLQQAQLQQQQQNAMLAAQQQQQQQQMMMQQQQLQQQQQGQPAQPQQHQGRILRMVLFGTIRSIRIGSPRDIIFFGVYKICGILQYLLTLISRWIFF